MRTDRRGPAPFEADTADDATLAALVAADAERCVREHLMMPTIRRYAQAVDPIRNPLAAAEVAAQVVEIVRSDRDRLVARLVQRYPRWAPHLRRAALTMDLSAPVLDGVDLPTEVGSPLADGRRRFQIVDQLSQGSEGVVALAVDRCTGEEKDAVVKFKLRAPSAMPPGIRGTAHAGEPTPWESEARRTTRAACRCTVRVLECGTIDATSTGDGEGAVGFIAFERVQGTPLAALIAAECDLDPDELANEFLDIARGLDSMHHRGIVHGDISPANLLLGDDGKLRLIDFGNGVQHGSASAQRDSQQLAMCIVAAALGHIPSAGRLDAWLRLDVAGALARSATRAVGRDMDAAALADAVASEVAATRRWRVVVGAAVTIIVFGGMLLAAEVAAM